MKTNEIHMRDPYVVVEPEENFYYLFGTTDENCWKGPGEGFNCFRSRDLCDWEGPIPAFRPSSSFWGKENFWAPEVHLFNGKYHMFASFTAEGRSRATHILVSDTVSGPYTPLVEHPATPPDWECLDGTLYVDVDGNPWMVFCHAHDQIIDGSICAMRLSGDLKSSVGAPIFLFNASEASWVRDWPECKGEFITDGPFLHRLANGTLIMLWSSFGADGYAMGIARSETGRITGPWIQNAEPLWGKDGGHGMLFRAFDGRLFMTFHSPNKFSEERPVFIEVEETDNGLVLATSDSQQA